MNVDELLYRRLLLPAVARHADQPMATDALTGITTTFSEQLARVQQLLGGLRQLGVGRGDRFAVMALNSTDYIALYHAALLGGGVVNPLNLRFASNELIHVLRDSGTRVCFVDPAFAPLIDRVREEAGIEHVVAIGETDVEHCVTFEELLGTSTPVLPVEGAETDPVVLMYTGGTTGLPKGVLLD